MSAPQAPAARERFAGRTAFIFAAIGSAVGLGNIWRFPYIAYENGGGAFIIPYLVALMTAGIPLLFFDYAIGHRFRGSPPLAFRRLGGRAEIIGWWQVGIAFVIALYYAVIIAWALRYAFFSLSRQWGDDTEGFFTGEFLQQSDTPGLSLQFVPGVAIPLALIWIVALVILGLGVQKGIARANLVFVPLLVVLFVVLVVRALFLDGAATGLDALFSPEWSALGNPTVWVAAYGQIFFSLSIAFGIMVTYASYLKRKTNLTGSGLVVAFSNSGFEILAGIGVFAALGFMSAASGTAVSDVVDSGIGLSFIAFPEIISQMPGGSIFGFLFFGALVLAGFTSLISIVEVVVASVSDKSGLPRRTAVWIVGGAMAVISLLLFPTTTGLNLLDVTDNFANNVGIVGVALAALITIGWAMRKLPELRDHLNAVSSFKLGIVWQAMLIVVTPVVLGYMFVQEVISRITEGYEGLPGWFVGVFGWGVAAALVAIAFVLAPLPWNRQRREGDLTDDMTTEGR